MGKLSVTIFLTTSNYPPHQLCTIISSSVWNCTWKTIPAMAGFGWRGLARSCTVDDHFYCLFMIALDMSRPKEKLCTACCLSPALTFFLRTPVMLFSVSIEFPCYLKTQSGISGKQKLIISIFFEENSSYSKFFNVKLNIFLTQSSL